MDLSFNESQRALQTTALEFLEQRCPMTQVRDLEESELGYSTELWKQMADLDWLGITFPQRYGGSEGSLLDLYVIYQALGRTLTPSPHMACFLAGETLLRGGSEEQQERTLPAIARGDLVVAPALMEASGVYGAQGIELDAARDGGGRRLNGVKLLVPYAHVAGYVRCAARTRRDADDTHGITLFLLDARADGLSIEPLQNIAGYKLFAVTFRDVEAPDSAVVGAVDEGWAPLSAALDRAAVLQCAEIVGAAEAVLDMAVNYAKERVQFGRPIGQYQAVQYLCSDIAIDMHLT
ncbi:MAG: acyl-CoA dehydrogenase family protein, partial [Dehalococcoidia bacterium]